MSKSIFLIFMLWSIPMFADEYINYGLLFSFSGRGIYASDFKGFEKDCCPGYLFGYGHSMHMGLLLSFPQNHKSSWQAAIKAGYTKDYFSRQKSILMDAGAPIQGIIEHSSINSYFSLGLQTSFNYKLSEKMDIIAGVESVFPLSQEYTSIQKILYPDDIVFAANKQRQLMNSGFHNSITEINVFAGLMANSIQEKRSFDIRPFFLLGSSITDAFAGMPFWRILYATAGIAVQWNKSKEEKAIPYELPDVTPVIDSGFKVKQSAQKFKYYIVHKADTLQHLTMIRKVNKKIYPLLNYIFFDSASALLPERYIQSSYQEIIPEIYHSVLGIIANRLQADTNSTIVVKGYKSGDEKNIKNLAFFRADAIADYLKIKYEIPASKIQTEYREGLPANASSELYRSGGQENRRVELYSSNPEILAPVSFNDTSFKPQSEYLYMVNPLPVITKNTSWKLEMRFEDRIIIIDSGTHIVPDTFMISMADLPMKSELPDSINIQLHIAGKDKIYRLSNYASIPIKKIRIDGIVAEEYNLLTFDYNSSIVNASHLPILEEINSRIQPGTHIVLTGYSDASGSEEYNKQLSLRRAREIAKYIKADTITIQGAGSINAKMEFPEQRFYSRTVKILVEKKAD